MIGKPEWFQRRKYGGWGLAPKTWQAWAYIAVTVIAVFAIQNIPGLSTTARITATAILAVALLADTLHIMAHLKLDEREIHHEAIAERNAMWAIVFVLAMGLAYQIASGAARHKVEFDPVIAAALIIAVMVKCATNLYLERKG